MDKATVERTAQPVASPPSASPALAPLRPSRMGAVFYALIASVGILLVLYAWRIAPFDGQLVETENAMVRGQVTVIGTQLSGYVDEVLVEDFDVVHEGQLLVRLDTRAITQRVAHAQSQLDLQRAALANWPQQRRSAQAGVKAAEANLAAAGAHVVRTKADLRRADQLTGDGSLSIRERDQLLAIGTQAVAAQRQNSAALDIAFQHLRGVHVNRNALAAAVAGAEATLQAAQVDLENATIRAPRQGQLGQVAVRRGAYVNAGAHLMGLVPPTLWVVANFKETQMHRVKEGQHAKIEVDALGGAKLEGQVERISPATGSEFSTLPADNATGNFVKIAQRIPVRISVAGNQAGVGSLRPGMSVVVRIDTGGAR